MPTHSPRHTHILRLDRQSLRDGFELTVSLLVVPELPLVVHAGIVEAHSLFQKSLESQELAGANTVEPGVAQLRGNE